MYQLLIVDDEIHAIRGIEAELEWNKLGISKLHTATNARQAKEVFDNHPIDVMICDIEMPEVNGLQLVAWVKEFYPSAESIFLTCHSEFHYAKEAIHLGSLEYILKPAPAYELESAIAKAIDKIHAEREQHTFHEILQKYHKLWSIHQPLVIERFWSDLIHQNIPSHPEAIEKALASLEVPSMSNSLFLPIYIKVERWHKAWTKREEKIMEYALRNAAEEVILEHCARGQALPLSGGEIICMLATDGTGVNPIDREQLASVCRDYIVSCNQYFYCDLSCYIGHPVAIQVVVGMLNSLYERERRNVAEHNRAILLDKAEFSPSAFVLPEMSVIDKVIRYIADHRDQNLTRELIANHVFLNPDYLARIFKRETGLSIMDYLTEERMGLAKKLLAQTDLPISSIAEKVGIPNFSYFSKQFKKYMNMSPLEYRHQKLGGR
ncbi:response regulator [Paenibacillus sp. LHD-117]|uniref:response regulator transcription factor n=1 Tax=Paenibacillus sp. LHD-117 TaxID=3071412 RepID=UPI0027DEF535|nr:helix-turn-helix domain-containing protein [Paenibacillus sp. LHD-117]MDQ6418036.1 response regulator [Paenibacillus sp. LHD-117]